MWLVTIGFGVALTLVGLWAYQATDRASVTALIPSFLGVVFVALGQFARDDTFRKHAMHIAAGLGLLGLAAAVIMLIRAMGRENFAWGIRETELTLMGVLCGAFLVLCIKSFIDARRARSASAEPGSPGGSPSQPI